MAIALRPPRPDEGDFFFATRRAGFRDYATQAFGPWDDVKHRASAARDFATLPVEIVDRDGVAIGYQIIERKTDHWWLDEIAIIASEQNRGVGSDLVRAIQAAARTAAMPLRLSVLDVNPAQRLYARLGFRVTSIEPPRIKMEWP